MWRVNQTEYLNMNTTLCPNCSACMHNNMQVDPKVEMEVDVFPLFRVLPAFPALPAFPTSSDDLIFSMTTLKIDEDLMVQDVDYMAVDVRKR